MRKIALLVANDSFPEDASIPPLRFAQNDASELKKILDDPETCCFETKLYLNESSQKVLADLEQISGELEPDDTLLFYYAGHGKLRRDGQLCLASKDTTMANLGARSIRARDVLYYLQESHARRRVLILDCCQSGAIGREFRGDDLQSALGGLADSFGSYILTASTAIQLAEEREKDGHGVFTKALIDCLREGRKDRITLTDLYDYAYARLKITAKQTPRLWTIEQEGTPIEIASYVAKHKLQQQKAADELISKARIQFDALQVAGFLTQGQVASFLRHLECDEANLLPHEREFRKNLIRYLNGELDFVSVFAAARIPEGSADHSVIGHISGVGAQVLREPPVVDRPVARPERLVVRILKDPNKRAIWSGGGAVVVATGIWALTFVVEHKDAHDKTGGIAAGGNIAGGNILEFEQIRKPSAEPAPLNLAAKNLAAKPPPLTLLVGDVAAGEAVYTQKCKVCHQIGEGAKNFVGPELNGLIGRKAGSVPNYDYSDANKESGLTWDEAILKEYLLKPKAKIPGTKMIFAGLPKEGDRDDLVAYLAQFGADGKK